MKITTIFLYISFVSWLFFLVTGWVGFFKFAIKKDNKDYYKVIWSFIATPYKDLKICFPLSMDYTTLIIIFAILLSFGTIALFAYIFKTIIRKEEHIFNGMIGTFTRYNFIPLICAACIFIIGITLQNDTHLNDFDDIFNFTSNKFVVKYGFNLAFSILGLFSLVFLKMKTKINYPFYIVYTINEGLYSFLIALFTYCFFYSIIFTGIFDKLYRYSKAIKNQEYPKANELRESINPFIKNCNIAFSVLTGIINVCIGCVLRDIGIPLMNLIIYIGLTVFFYSFDKDTRNENNCPSEAGIIDIVMIVVSCLGIAFGVFIKIKNKNKNKEITLS